MARHQRKYVAYYRVSTQRQGRSGLGLEAQQKAVRDYLNGGTWDLAGEFTEVETGKGSKPLKHRPALKEALEICKRKKATLLVAKLDRLARNVAFIAALMESKVEFIACDFPEANRLTVHILAAVAEHEREMISQRTKEALAAAKARGVKLGNPRFDLINKPRGREARKFASMLKPTLQAYQGQGLTQRQMVAALNDADVPSPRGGRWHAQTLTRVLKRLSA